MPLSIGVFACQPCLVLSDTMDWHMHLHTQDCTSQSSNWLFPQLQLKSGLSFAVKVQNYGILQVLNKSAAGSQRFSFTNKTGPHRTIMLHHRRLPKGANHPNNPLKEACFLQHFDKDQDMHGQEMQGLQQRSCPGSPTGQTDDGGGLSSGHFTAERAEHTVEPGLPGGFGGPRSTAMA